MSVDEMSPKASIKLADDAIPAISLEAGRNHEEDAIPATTTKPPSDPEDAATQAPAIEAPLNPEDAPAIPSIAMQALPNLGDATTIQAIVTIPNAFEDFIAMISV